MWIGDFVRCHSVVRLLQGALSRPAGRRADHDAVRAAARLHAGRAQGHRLRSAAQAPGLGASTGRSPPGWRAEHYGTRAGDAADLEIGAGAVPRRHSRAHRLCRRGPLRPAERHPLRRKEAAPHDRPLRRAGAAERRSPAGRMAEARTRRAGARRPRSGAPRAGLPTTAGRWSPLRRARSARASAGRSYFAELARKLTAEGFAVWVLGSPAEAPLAAEIVAAAGPAARDLTSTDLRNAILALKCASACVSNDSGLVHVAAAIGTPTVGIFGPTSPWHWAPLNPLAAVIETTDRRALPALPQADLPARPPPLHARHPGRPGAARRAPRACRPDSAHRGLNSLPEAPCADPRQRSRPRSSPPLAAGGRARVGRRKIRRRDRRHRRAHRRRR